MGNNPMNGTDPDGALFGRVRAHMNAFFTGGIALKTDAGTWIVNNYDINTGVFSQKDFGYGGLGRVSIQTNSSIETKLDFGIVNYVDDKGVNGKSFKALTVDLLSSKINYNSETGKTVNSYDHLGKNGRVKGTLLSVNIEQDGIDLKAGVTYDNKNGVNTTQNYGGAGAPGTEVKVTHLSKHGINFKIGFQEDFGKSASLLGGESPFLSFGVKLDLRVQKTVQWKF